MLIPSIPALTFSAINVPVYNDKAKNKAINSGGIASPPIKVPDVLDNCLYTGYSISKLDKPNINDNDGTTIKINIDIYKIGYCFPRFC